MHVYVQAEVLVDQVEQVFDVDHIRVVVLCAQRQKCVSNEMLLVDLLLLLERVQQVTKLLEGCMLSRWGLLSRPECHGLASSISF